MIGPALQKIVVGGDDYGNQTLTRLFGLHVGVLPLLFAVAVAIHVALVRRHGLTPPRGRHPPRPADATTAASKAKRRFRSSLFWPEQLFKNTVAATLVLGLIVVFTIVNGGGGLDSPANPSNTEYPARPEWFFLWLYQLRHYFAGPVGDDRHPGDPGSGRGRAGVDSPLRPGVAGAHGALRWPAVLSSCCSAASAP